MPIKIHYYTETPIEPKIIQSTEQQSLTTLPDIWDEIQTSETLIKNEDAPRDNLEKIKTETKIPNNVKVWEEYTNKVNEAKKVYNLAQKKKILPAELNKLKFELKALQDLAVSDTQLAAVRAEMSKSMFKEINITPNNANLKSVEKITNARKANKVNKPNFTFVGKELVTGLFSVGIIAAVAFSNKSRIADSYQNLTNQNTVEVNQK